MQWGIANDEASQKSDQEGLEKFGLKSGPVSVSSVCGLKKTLTHCKSRASFVSQKTPTKNTH